MSTCSDPGSTEPSLSTSDIELPRCEFGVGTVIRSPDDGQLLQGAQADLVPVWPDDRGHFLEVHRVGCGLSRQFPHFTTQVSATVTYPGIVKAFHYHLRQYDCWTVVKGMMQVALVDLRRQSPTFGMRNTLYVGEMRPWQVLIPPGVAHGYKVITPEPAVLVYVTSQFYNPSDEYRIPFNDPALSYDWSTQFK